VHQETEESTSNIPKHTATNNFFAPLRDLPVANAEMASNGNPLKHLEQMRVCAKGRPPLIIITPKANLISLQRELKSAVSREFFRNTATGTRITTKSILTVLPQLAVDKVFISGIQVAQETGTGSELGS
jgi:hypothetical protein